MGKTGKSIIIKAPPEKVWETLDFDEGVKTSNTHFYDLVFMVAGFKAPTENLVDLLPTKKLQPVESTKGFTIVKIYALEYKKWGVKDQLLPPYNEWAFIIPAQYVSETEPKLNGEYVVWMPVTHEIPMRGGIDGWGFNKFMSEIRFRETADTRTCSVTVNGKKLISFTIRKPDVSEHQLHTYVFNKLNGQITRALVQFKGTFGETTVPNSAGFALGDHPVARQIALLQLEQTSDQAMYGVNVRANLHAYDKTLTL